jgi:biotin operon repressor
VTPFGVNSMNSRTELAASSRDSHLALRRVERQQALIERLHAAHGQRVHSSELATDLRVSERTIARDVERLRLSGVPISTHPGRAGGISLNPIKTTFSLQLDLPEAAALLSSLTVLGPTTSERRLGNAQDHAGHEPGLSRLSTELTAHTRPLFRRADRFGTVAHLRDACGALGGKVESSVAAADVSAVGHRPWALEIHSDKGKFVEPRGLEPLTPCLQSKCATNCAMAPVSRSPIPESGPADP